MSCIKYTQATGLNTALNVCFLPAVPTFPEEGCQQAPDHAAATEALQKQDHPGLQDPGAGTHQHGRGTIATLSQL